MKQYPAIALIELSSVAAGIFTGDAMIKHSPITMLKTGTVSRGNFLILVGGSVASVEEAYAEGLSRGGDAVADKVILPDIHPQVHDAILGARRPCHNDALAVIETRTVAALISSTDAAIKGALVDIVEMRLADGIGGKAFAIFTGRVEDVEAAVDVARGKITRPYCWVGDRIVPRLHEDMARQIDVATRFAQVEPQNLEGGEI